MFSTPFIRNLGSMGGAQIAMRVSRLLATIVLTRLLSPNDFGLAAIVLTTHELVALFTRNGIAAQVVRAEPNAVAQTAETAYWLSWIACGGLALAQALIALPVMWIYDDARLALPIALMGLVHLATPLCHIQCVMMQREGRLGRIALASGLQVSADNILTGIFALMGFGMWAIVLPKLLVAPIWVVVTRYGHDWRPASRWWPANGLVGWREALGFSRHVLAVELMTTVQANVDNLIVGLTLGVEALGVYYFAFNAGLGITLGLVNAFGSAIYPHLCQVVGDRVQLAARYRQALRTSGLILVPLVLAQVLLAPIYVPLVFGEKWVVATPVLMLICLSALPRPFANACSQLLKAIGRPDIEPRWQLALTVLLIAGVFLGSRFGIVGVAVAVLAVQGIVLTLFCLRAPRPYLRDTTQEWPRSPATVAV